MNAPKFKKIVSRSISLFPYYAIPLLVIIGLLLIAFFQFYYIYWGEFNEKINDADRIEIWSMESYQKRFPGEFKGDDFIEAKPDIVIVKPETLNEFKKNLQFNLINKRGACACEGQALIYFFKNNNQICRATVHHGIFIRAGCTSGNVRLTGSSSKWLKKWLDEKGLEKIDW